MDPLARINALLAAGEAHAAASEFAIKVGPVVHEGEIVVAVVGSRMDESGGVVNAQRMRPAGQVIGEPELLKTMVEEVEAMLRGPNPQLC